ncbi:hypothetical protein CDD82_6422 [Ophiocordyceps australis]|uniref:SWIRM domain-containing protein n=1 Tax=Ophiocordyceps australis TaxID=1399860 RepID=A0A2C5YV38_9HYPO|nr:hypothetical protein CDD82_6422 [Ophiocordyceps australis]
MADKPMPQHSIIFEKDPQVFTTAVQSSTAVALDQFSFPQSLPMASNSQLRLQHHTPMAPPPLPAMTSCPTQSKKLDINSLMSPPDLVLDSFNHLSPASKTPFSKAAHPPGHQQPLMSPPVSPLTKPIVASADSCRLTPAIAPHHSKDPVLYPSEDHSSLVVMQAPLFVPAELEQRRIVEQHVRARSQHHDMFALVAPPRREDYELILSFKIKVLELFRANPSAWLRKERALLQADRRAGAGRWRVSGPSRTLASKASTKRSGDRVHKVSTSTTTTTTTAGHHKPLHANASSRQTRKISGASSVSMPAARGGAATGRVSVTPEPSRRGQAPNREDKNFDALPDYCPPLDSLPDRPNCLKTEWRGNPIDLGNDPHLHLLHRDEVPLAANLRLDCATYLTSKRRIFERRLQCLRTGKEFRKTDAQQACKIDVNKASKLWTAFEKVGWLNAHWVRQFV